MPGIYDWVHKGTAGPGGRYALDCLPFWLKEEVNLLGNVWTSEQCFNALIELTTMEKLHKGKKGATKSSQIIF